MLFRDWHAPASVTGMPASMTGMPSKHDWYAPSNVTAACQSTPESMLITPRHICVTIMLLHEQTMIYYIASRSFMLFFHALYALGMTRA